ncbi:hypothetical protein [Nocardia bovistercoris]|uniref:Uncharacterized protein n=1 Tax=Nocardia bovistercoris TaxID=2785916 RepID=A0A931IJW0_9NOCA|nr:hypothetical protein [Nocardia bovistercoris]MBH0781000.1 hypothetical protein [Nocardia bovistercoris]
MQPDLIVYESITFAGLVAAAALGIPALAHFGGRAARTGDDEEQPGAVARVCRHLSAVRRCGEDRTVGVDRSLPDRHPAATDR